VAPFLPCGFVPKKIDPNKKGGALCLFSNAILAVKEELEPAQIRRIFTVTPDFGIDCFDHEGVNAART
jgi:hypothetical protein